VAARKALNARCLVFSDVTLVHLKKTDLFKTVLPSKIFEAASMERPILLGVEGYSADLIRAAEAGLCIEPENAEELVVAVCRLADEPTLGAQFGKHERRSIQEKLSSRKAGRKISFVALNARHKGEDRAMKTLNIVGARPNFVKTAPLMEAYKAFPHIQALLVHTDQRLLTLHRPSNVDDPAIFARILDALEVIQHDLPLRPSVSSMLSNIRYRCCRDV
jgi:hypothetical protein